MRYIVVGGAGCIGSHFVDALLSDTNVTQVTIYDNFSSGRAWHYYHNAKDYRLSVIRNDVENNQALTEAMIGHDVVIHLASNPDIAKAVKDPSIDFWQGTALTNSVLEAMRKADVKKLLYASGSGVYGDVGQKESKETDSLLPVSTYGSSKLAGEALIRSYCYMFGLSAVCFRFGNVVGARQTHGVGLDFCKRLFADPTKLTILGNGLQEKSYIYVQDVVRAVLLASKKLDKPFEEYNVATGDYITVNKIAKIVCKCLNIDNVKFEYTGGDRGWKGDVPIVKLNTDKIRKLGWNNVLSTEGAVTTSILELLPDIKAGRL